MGYFRIKDKIHNFEFDVKAPPGRQVLYTEIENIVGQQKCPVNGIPFAIEVDGWGELAAIGEEYETDDFCVKCIDWMDYNDD